MSLKLLADKYIELSVKAIAEITKDNYQNFNGIAEDYLFLYCRTGSMKIIVDDNPYELNENDIILIRINSSYSIEKDNFSTIFLAFNGSSAEDLISVMEFENNMYHDDSHLGYYFYKIYHAYHEAEFLSIKCLGILYELFYELTKNANVIDVDYNNQQKHVEIAKEYINQNYADAYDENLEYYIEHAIDIANEAFAELAEDAKDEADNLLEEIKNLGEISKTVLMLFKRLPLEKIKIDNTKK